MPDPARFQLTIADGKLSVRVLMIEPLHVFKTGRKGHTFREYFDWDGKRWRVQFRAFLNTPPTHTTHGKVIDRADAERASAKFASILGSALSSYVEANSAAREGGGWSFSKLATGVHAQFNFSGMRDLPPGKIASFASFHVEIDGLEYLGQFHLKQEPESHPKPTAWDWSKGAKAGLPTLGKRR